MRKTSQTLAVAAIAALLATPAAAERFELGDLADGETRIFTSGSKSLTATRSGDTIDMTVAEPGEDDRSFDCDVSGRNRCAIELDRDADQIKIEVMRREERTVGDGDDLQDQTLAELLGEDCDGCKRVIVRKHIDHPDGDHQVIQLKVAGEPGEAVFFGDDGENVFIESLDDVAWTEAGADAQPTMLFIGEDGEPVVAGGDTWVSSDDVDVVDLGDLADGETRIFGSGDDSITAQRVGDTAYLTVRDDDGEGRELQCDLAADSCRILSHDHGDGDTTVVAMIRRGGDAARTVEVIVGDHAPGGHGQHMMIIERSGDAGAGHHRLRRVEVKK